MWFLQQLRLFFMKGVLFFSGCISEGGQAPPHLFCSIHPYPTLLTLQLQCHSFLYHSQHHLSIQPWEVFGVRWLCIFSWCFLHCLSVVDVQSMYPQVQVKNNLAVSSRTSWRCLRKTQRLAQPRPEQKRGIMETAAFVSTPQHPKYLFLHQMQRKGVVMYFSVWNINVIEKTHHSVNLGARILFTASLGSTLTLKVKW